MRGRLEDGRKSQQKSEEYGVLITERTDPELEITDYGVQSPKLDISEYGVLITARTDPYPQAFVIRSL